MRAPQAHYVERISTLYFHNAGSLLMQLYRLVAPFIDPVTRDKIVFLPRSAAEAAGVLARDMDLQVGGERRAAGTPRVLWRQQTRSARMQDPARR